jgi:hypothetical protein
MIGIGKGIKQQRENMWVGRETEKDRKEQGRQQDSENRQFAYQKKAHLLALKQLLV